MKIALIQMTVTDDKTRNMKTAKDWIEKASQEKAQVVVLPEMFNCPYDNSYFEDFAEVEGGLTYRFLSEQAKEYNLLLVGGSVPEREGSNIYNTSYIFDKNGKLLAKHRKAHLFDIAIENGIRFMESDVLTPGDQATVFDTDFGRVGLCICYDIRFPELARRMTLDGARLIIVPGAFNMTTGPAHWELTARARALDNQVFYALCSPARVEGASYVAYGHSMVTNPWGMVVDSLDEGEGILITEVDFDMVDSIREQLPLLKHRRMELY
ncbi:MULTISPECIES: carbon-nitrogen hydrolase family protein [unclassified Fusibacter]|uniref:carbon-nitrogen hydrolase family protein n=1 Tax=unclassified Fusibacter TaxID=2624464 RepID=UPI0010126A8F|nr:MULTISPECIES: carbon-nitrogen hydrolase family protein [unclassified Fusibacter]MCK8061590.1 carbon-nitrogen hydrolase family protein [Fusibacter sp. A2]NPE23773.1 carbon-nitrogen hydrolase family protein [Fusibacter sp. A1]RXV58678.1 carbon-nitrogen hydrolase family protein [Fusibacter sp. A1]